MRLIAECSIERHMQKRHSRKKAISSKNISIRSTNANFLLKLFKSWNSERIIIFTDNQHIGLSKTWCHELFNISNYARINSAVPMSLPTCLDKKRNLVWRISVQYLEQPFCPLERFPFIISHICQNKKREFELTNVLINFCSNCCFLSSCSVDRIVEPVKTNP